MVRRIKIENLRFIDEEEVPKRVVRTPWEEVFSKIPKGKALVIQHDEVRATTVRGALKTLQKKGKFKNLVMTTRKADRNKYMSYILNPSEETE